MSISNILKSKNLFVFLSIIFIFSFLSFAIVNAQEWPAGPPPESQVVLPAGPTPSIESPAETPQTATEKSSPYTSPKPATQDSGTKSGARLTGDDGGGQVTISLPNPLKASTFAELIARLNKWLLYIGAPILTLMIIIGAFQIMTAGGVPDKITRGRKTITYAIIGYALLLLSTGITTIIENVLGAK